MATPQHKPESKDKNLHQYPQDVHNSGDENTQVSQSMTAVCSGMLLTRKTRTVLYSVFNAKIIRVCRVGQGSFGSTDATL
jgi:hypothetical protein